MLNPKRGVGIVTGANVEIGKDVAIWNYVVIGDDAKIGDGTLIGSFCDIGKEVVIRQKMQHTSARNHLKRLHTRQQRVYRA